MTKSDLVRKFITENPNIKAKKEIARILHESNPEFWNTIEDARSIVRQVTGSVGKKSREKYTSFEKTKFFYNGFEKWAEENLNIELTPWNEPFKIPPFKKLNIIADLHSVNLNHKCLQAFLKASSNKEALIINGDLMDSESLSRHIKGHNLIGYEDELELCHNLLKGFKEEFNHVYFKHGNHDFWLERYLLTNAREIFRLRGLSLNELLRCGELGVHPIHNLQYWQYGDLDGVHGHEFPGFGMGKFPATGLLDKWQRFKGKTDVKVIASHCHRNDHAIGKKSVDGKWGDAWTTPAMCNKMASFNPFAGWDCGWGELNINNDGITEIKMTVK